MNYLFQFDDAALALVLEGLAKLPLERSLPLYQQMQAGAQQQRKAAKEQPQEPSA